MDFGGVGARQARALRYVAEGSSGPPVDPRLRITLNFHPDRTATATGRPILDALAQDGTYHSQFVTGTSNGGLTARPGGDRWRWESRIFAGAYDDAPASERPVYGALNFRRQVVGAAPRFGSSHFRLRGTTLARDMEALVLDGSYRGTPVETAARRLPCPVEWHPGYRLTMRELHRHADYRGQQYADLGGLIAERGVIDPRVIGDAARTGRHELQDLKMVWHTLARFGAPEGAGTAYRPSVSVTGTGGQTPGVSTPSA